MQIFFYFLNLFFLFLSRILIWIRSIHPFLKVGAGTGKNGADLKTGKLKQNDQKQQVAAGKFQYVEQVGNTYFRKFQFSKLNMYSLKRRLSCIGKMPFL